MTVNKRTISAFFSALVVVVVLPVVAAPSAGANAPASISVRASATDLPVGGSTIVTGHVRESGRAVADVPVEIWVRPVGSSAWRHTANAWTTRAGGYSVRQSYAQASVTMARFRGRHGGSTADATTIVAVHQSFAAVGIKGCADLPDNAWIEWQGRTSSAAAGSYALAQWRYSAAYPWHTLPATTVRADGTFSSHYSTGHGVFEARWILNGRVNVVGTASPTYVGDGPIGNFGPVECDQFTRE